METSSRPNAKLSAENAKALPGKILIEPVGPFKQEPVGRIIDPEENKEPYVGVVISDGGDTRPEGQRLKTSLQGKTVLVAKYALFEVSIGGRHILPLEHTDVVAVFD